MAMGYGAVTLFYMVYKTTSIMRFLVRAYRNSAVSAAFAQKSYGAHATLLGRQRRDDLRLCDGLAVLGICQ